METGSLVLLRVQLKCQDPKIPDFFENEAQALDTMSPETGDLRIVAHRVSL